MSFDDSLIQMRYAIDALLDIRGRAATKPTVSQQAQDVVRNTTNVLHNLTRCGRPGEGLPVDPRRTPSKL